MPPADQILTAIFLGFLEGVTEFLPISSTGHLILFVDLLGFQGPPGRVFEVVIQFGAIAAVMCVFWRKLWNVTRSLHRDPLSRHFVYALLLAFLPAALVGILAHGFIKQTLFNPLVAAAMLVLGGFAMLAIERFSKRTAMNAVEEITLPIALKIGLFQCLAMVPGVSRSGATIMGAMLCGVDRQAAAAFAFFLAIPTVLSAASYDLYKNYHNLGETDWIILAIGLVSAFMAALPIARGLIAFVGKHGFAPFAWYRICLGSGMLLYLSVI